MPLVEDPLDQMLTQHDATKTLINEFLTLTTATACLPASVQLISI